MTTMTNDDAELRALVARLITERAGERLRYLEADRVALEALREIAPEEMQVSHPLLRAAALAQLRDIARSLLGLPSEAEEDRENEHLERWAAQKAAAPDSDNDMPY